MSISNQENIEEEDEKLINEQLFKLVSFSYSYKLNFNPYT